MTKLRKLTALLLAGALTLLLLTACSGGGSSGPETVPSALTVSCGWVMSPMALVTRPLLSTVRAASVMSAWTWASWSSVAARSSGRSAASRLLCSMTPPISTSR